MPAAPEAADPYAAIAAAYDAEFEDAGADIAGYARRGVPGRLLVGGVAPGACAGRSPRCGRSSASTAPRR